MSSIVAPLRAQGQAVAIASCLFACVGTGEGVPDPGGDDSAAPETYDELVTEIFEPFCAAQCHRGGAAPKGLSLEPRRLIDQLVLVRSVEVPDLFRVEPGRPEQSYLIVKLVSSDARRVGARMPRGGPPFLSSRQIRALRRWIRDGARSDWVDTSSAAAVVTTQALEWDEWAEESEDEDP